MPYKKRGKWIAQIRKEGIRKGKTFKSKKDALEWESQLRQLPIEELEGKTRTACLIDWANEYLQYSKSMHTQKTYEEKRNAFRLLFKSVDSSTPVHALQRGQVLDFLLKQLKNRSGYSANKDRKNLLAAWHWGVENRRFPSLNPCLSEEIPRTEACSLCSP